VASHLNDIEEFTIDELRKEIRRREDAARAHKCWYCGQNIAAHTCKHATNPTAHGWEVAAPRWVATEDCMANEVSYWQVDAKHTVLGIHTCGTGGTADEATQKCLQHIQEREATWEQKKL
jgi:hypothetical protein